MKELLIIAASLAVVASRPELYREQEDFQYSRSSSDDGSKSGYYGAQRGNMGGNYEKAHNMDSLAQNQMSGLVRQVEGELGDGSNTRTGSVFSSANSRGIYGSGKYDLRNLEGRNFQEGVTLGDSRSHSALSSYDSAYTGHSSTAAHNSGYHHTQAADSRYQSARTSSQQRHSSNLQTVNNAHYDTGYNYDREAGYNSGYQSQSGQNGLYTNTNQHSSNGYGSNVKTRLVHGAAPARVVIRPGSTVIIPVAAQTYDSTHRESSLDHNAINSEAEVLSNTNQNHNYRPSSDAKHYESSYSYHKQWEKHDTNPSVAALAIPTENPIPKNSELYDDTQASHLSSGQYQARGFDSHSAHSNNAYNRYNSNVKVAASSQSRSQSAYDSEHRELTGSNSNAYTHGAVADTTNLVDDVHSKPKSYQSSYSYHKSWERQGDPYVIIPESSSTSVGQMNQKLTSDAGRNRYDSHQYGSRYTQGYQGHSHGSVDCDETGHTRDVRSAFDQQTQDQEQGQQTQDNWDQQSGFENLEDLGQQTQTNWDQQSGFEKLDDLGQQSQNNWNQQSGFEKLEDLGQQTQSNWNQQSGFEKLEDLGQQTQSNWNQQSGFEKLEDLGQQTQNNWNQQSGLEKLEDFGQQTQIQQGQQSGFQYSEDLKQQTNTYQQNNKNLLSNELQNLENLNQQTQSQNRLDQLEDHRQQTQMDLNQHSQEKWENGETIEKLEDIGQQSQSPWDGLSNIGQQESLETPQDQNLETDWKKQDIFYSQQQSQSNYGTQTLENQHLNYGHNTWDRLNTYQSQNSEQNIQTSDKFDQQNNWFQISQTQDKNSDQANERVGTSESNTQQVINSSNQDSDTNEFRTQWNDQTQQNYNHTESASTNYGNQNTNSLNVNLNTNNNSQRNTDRRSIQSLWDKINNFEQIYSIPKDNDETSGAHYLNEETNSFHWSETNNSDNNSTVQQSSYDDNQTNSHYNGYHNGHSIISKEVTSTTMTIKSSDLETHYNVEKLRPLDVGRGDIGPEDESISVNISTEKYVPIFIANSNDKQQKTAEEIESLSLTKESHESGNNFIEPANKTVSSYEQNPIEIEQQNTEQQFEDLGNFGQQSENLNEGAWSQDVFYDGQQVQSVWEPYKAIPNQENKTENFETLGRFNIEQDGTGNFDKQQYVNDREVFQNELIQKTEDLKIIPETNQNEKKIQPIAQKIPDPEVPSPPEPTTEKPGFWKSVGNKFSSWFKRN